MGNLGMVAASAIGLLTIAQSVTDFLMFNPMPSREKRNMYHYCVHDYSPDFGDIIGAMQERGLHLAPTERANFRLVKSGRYESLADLELAQSQWVAPTTDEVMTKYRD